VVYRWDVQLSVRLIKTRPGRLARAAAIGLLVGAIASGAGVSVATGQRGVAARAITLHESGHLRLTSRHGFTLNERGSASGTITGTIYIHLNIVSTNRVTAEVNIYPSGGSLSGYAKASYHVAGPTAGFAGSMSIIRGSGGYGHARGSGLSFSGTIQRSNDAVTVHLSGAMSD